MAINKNHEFEEIDGVKCGIVEKNVTTERLTFLKKLLELNGYAVISAPSPPPKKAPAPPVKTGETETIINVEPPPPETFTVGVTDTTFNPINAIFGRLLKTGNGHVVTLAYWQQKEHVSHDEIPYFNFK